jgi:hypothetical protein
MSQGPHAPGTCPNCGAPLMFDGQSICHRCAKAIADPTRLFRPARASEKPDEGAAGEAKTPEAAVAWKPASWSTPWKPAGLGIGSAGPEAESGPAAGIGSAGQAQSGVGSEVAATPASRWTPPGLAGSMPGAGQGEGAGSMPVAGAGAPGYAPAQSQTAWRDTARRDQRPRSGPTTTYRPARAGGSGAGLAIGLIIVGIFALIVVASLVPATPEFTYEGPDYSYAGETYDWGTPEPTPVPTSELIVPPTPEAPSAQPTSEVSGSPASTPREYPSLDPLAPVGRLRESRANQTATLLPDGRVAIIGGVSNAGPNAALASVEIYDPSSRSFAAGGRLLTPRFDHTATLLADGTILVAGGKSGDGSPLASAEIYDPKTHVPRAVGDLNTPRSAASAGVTAGGVVVIVGGRDASGEWVQSPEAFDSETGGFREQHPVYGSYRDGMYSFAPVVMLLDGRVLVVGGTPSDEPGEFLAIFDTTATGFGGTDVSIEPGRAARTLATTCLLSDGRVLVVGGLTADGVDGTIEIIDPGNFATFLDSSPRPSLITPRIRNSLTALPDGSALILGGNDADGSPTATVERWYPGQTATTPVGAMAQPRADHTATLLADGSVLVVGGRSSSTKVIADAGIYRP